MEQREALEYLVNLGYEKEPIVRVGGLGVYSKDKLIKMEQPVADTLKVTTLTGLIDYIKSNIDKVEEELLIQVKSNEEVNLYSPLNEDRNRELFLRAEAILPSNIRYDRFLDTEQFNIMLQSSFVDRGDRKTLLTYTALTQDGPVRTIGDDGVSQQVTVKTGVASLENAKVPNPVELAPYRTFPEVEQPTSKFIFRMKEGPSAALFEADGGAWRNEAIKNIKEYLAKELEEFKNVKIIA
ncbi:hypothetical protein QTI11_14605 [Clostridium perfringens]|nr:hypothetical protein [Clostridium perfringens]MDM0804588.1 hypothetical protein [Clostridium perfringens]HAT4172330.1 hypothetical protein [Clostridium perfringens]